MRKIILVSLLILSAIVAFAEDKYHINVLNEISSQTAKSYPKQWEISTYRHTDYRGVTTTRYFIFAPNIKHGSQIKLTGAKGSGSPWKASINGQTYYVDFNTSNDLKVGDEGVLKYNGDRLYFYSE